jgi:flagellar biosynthesis/type III secretory pathway M-ring protein FliF/YscJ
LAYHATCILAIIKSFKLGNSTMNNKVTSHSSKPKTNRIVYLLIAAASVLVIIALITIGLNTLRQDDDTSGSESVPKTEERAPEDTNADNNSDADSQPTTIEDLSDPLAPSLPSIELPNQ